MKKETVGLKNISHPITVQTLAGATQHTVADICIEAILPHGKFSTYPEKILPLLMEHSTHVDLKSLTILIEKIQQKLSAAEIRCSISFPYFVKKTAPVSSTQSLMEYQCTLAGTSKENDLPRMSVVVPVTTLCPCSKEISSHGAHNQRAEAVLTIKSDATHTFEEMISLIEQCGSCQLYALLKRPDEKFVTETAYKNPMFVEDVARKIAMTVKNNEAVQWFSVSVESFESIHKHSAYAYIDSRDLQN